MSTSATAPANKFSRLATAALPFELLFETILLRREEEPQFGEGLSEEALKPRKLALYLVGREIEYRHRAARRLRNRIWAWL
ncbi:hypothetical protein EKO04_011411 [Ascochyta lentis]|uniref:Uncharacterized protein n=1 Tax=Ascochyta lentis TaxID=205686 RepID=A0A8H7ITH5_9PLEO|nr:hypothetical protein EKO04_011411 [Ascochyta lentis]